MTQEQQKIEELEGRIESFEHALTSLMDVIYDHYQLKDPHGAGDSEIFEIIKYFHGEQ